MTAMQIIFILSALMVVGAAFMVVTTKNLVHAALYLVATLFGVAVLYALLNAGFMAVVQIVVYIGAIAILFIFAIMLTRREMRDKGEQTNRNWGWAALFALLAFAGLFLLVSSWSGFTATAADLPADFDGVVQLGTALVSADAFVLPFEVASVLLVAALIGAVYLAGTKK